jgi:hypothetical protein
LGGNPAAPVSGSGSVTLSASQVDSSEYLTVFDEFGGGTKLLDSTTFANPTPALDVSVEFLADAENRGGVVASLIQTTFSQEQGVVPEMSSLATWTVLLFGVSLVVIWRKLNDQKLSPIVVAKER